MRIKFSKMEKVHQVEKPEKRVQFLKVQSEGIFKLKDGCQIRVFPKDIGKTVVLETCRKIPTNQSFSFHRVTY